MDLIMVRRNNVALGGNEVGGWSAALTAVMGLEGREDGKRGEDAER